MTAVFSSLFGIVFILFCVLSVGKTQRFGNWHGGDVCLLPKKTGPCRARFIRYYYDSRRNRCLSFVYGGCSSNGNNFDTNRECLRACSRRRRYRPASYRGY